MPIAAARSAWKELFLALGWEGTIERIHHALYVAVREQTGLEPSPTTATINSQTAKAARKGALRLMRPATRQARRSSGADGRSAPPPEVRLQHPARSGPRSGGTGVAGRRGFDAAKRVVGRKRHALVDTDGRLLLAAVSPASLHDSHGGIALLQILRRPWPFVPLCYADRAYAGARVADATTVRVELVGPKPGQRGFSALPRRWVIERGLAWAARCRRLARDHEAMPSSAIAFFVLAAATVLLRRLARPL